MPPPVVRSPLGLPLGDWGLLPLQDALPAVGAGVVAGGPYTLPILKGCWIPVPGVSSRTGAQRGWASSSAVPRNQTAEHIRGFSFSTTHEGLGRTRAAWPRTADQRGHAAHSGGVILLGNRGSYHGFYDTSFALGPGCARAAWPRTADQRGRAALSRGGLRGAGWGGGMPGSTG